MLICQIVIAYIINVVILIMYGHSETFVQSMQIKSCTHCQCTHCRMCGYIAAILLWVSNYSSHSVIVKSLVTETF